MERKTHQRITPPEQKNGDYLKGDLAVGAIVLGSVILFQIGYALLAAYNAGYFPTR